MKIGRNDLCSCGSGKKYKKCCESVNTEVGDFAWVKLRNLEKVVCGDHLIPYAMSRLPKGFLIGVFAEFIPFELPDDVDRSIILDNFFIPWFLFNWIEEEAFIEGMDYNHTIAENYLRIYGYKLSKQERAFLEAMTQTYYSFYSVVDVEPEKTLIMKDILLGTEHRIKEKQGTRFLNRGDIIFTRILTMEDQSISIGMAPWVIKPSYHSDIIDFRESIKKDEKKITPQLLRGDLHFDLLEYFFSIMENLFNPSFPDLRNTDGDPIVFTKSYFKISLKPEEILKKLSPMTLEEDTGHFLENAKRDKMGNVTRLEIPWLKKGNKMYKSWDTTILGHFTVEQGRIILESNSHKRATAGRKLIEKHGQGVIQFQRMLIESPEEKMKSNPLKKNKGEIPFEKLPEELQNKMKEMAKQHWGDWFDTPIPLLDNETPKEASKSKIGREKLEALLLSYENEDRKRTKNDVMKADTNYLRNKLGLHPLKV